MSFALDIKKFIPSFYEYLVESEQAWSNLHAYRTGKEPLKNAILPHPAGDKVYDFVMSNVKRNFWQHSKEVFRKVGMGKTKIQK